MLNMTLNPIFLLILLIRSILFAFTMSIFRNFSIIQGKKKMAMADFRPSEAWMPMRAYRDVFTACLRSVIGIFCLLIMRSYYYNMNFIDILIISKTNNLILALISFIKGNYSAVTIKP